jgi:putative endonuclease
MSYTVYILRTSGNTLYVGQTNNIEKRIKEHKEKSYKSAKYLRMFPKFTLVHTEQYQTRSDALKREAELKKWPKDRKESLIQSCFQCGICCKLFLINLTEKEWRSGTFKTQFEEFGINDDFKRAEAYGATVLKQHDDGSCIYLKNNLCSIHKRRPQSCRNFFCHDTSGKFQNMIRQIKKRREDDTIRSC